MSYCSASFPGISRHGGNEDFVIVGNHSIVLADGATALVPGNWSSYPSDPAWFSHRLAMEVSFGCEGNPSSSLADIIASALTLLQREWKTFAPDDADNLSMPSSSLIVARWNDETLDTASIGDSTLLVREKDGKESVFDSTELSSLDKQVKQEMARLRDTTSMTFPEIRQAVDLMLKENRNKKNTPGGYWVADLGGTWIPHMQYASFPIGDVEYVFACSDGYSAAVEYGLFSSISEVAEQTSKGNGLEIVEEIRSVEAAENSLMEHIRFKVSDDCSFGFISFAS